MEKIKKYLWVAPVLCVFLYVAFLLDKEPGQEINENISLSPEHQTDAADTIAQPEVLTVDVKGEVRAPGIYEVKPGMRVNDAIELAGGLTDSADPVSVNRAQKLEDEMVVLVMATIEGGEKAWNKGGKIRINDASVEELTQLNGIGTAKAEAIIQHRDENGLFKKPEDLLDVSGVGESTLANIKEDIQLP
ncbi:helix-hairpin-helix domain-containing protein [Thalassobacillus sp. CUG 92003]|uniref:helix-hairpin-helix domain-containing protein n=1 Tax=Thalassobacillus sp. CUG 92003 TaxID=2736641 RepID=UPI002105D4C2|nr:helix-hairpin-helix domain-containing protein [Thalassobacillus sp. CUG 92003]